MKSIFNTSFTTACAFLANLASPLVPLRAFGIFAAIVVVMNYVIVVMWTPAGIVLYAKFLKWMPCVFTLFVRLRTRFMRAARAPATRSMLRSRAHLVYHARVLFYLLQVLRLLRHLAALLPRGPVQRPESTDVVSGPEDSSGDDGGSCLLICFVLRLHFFCFAHCSFVYTILFSNKTTTSEMAVIGGGDVELTADAVAVGMEDGGVSAEAVAPEGGTEAAGEEADESVVQKAHDPYGWIKDRYCTLSPIGPPSALTGVPFSVDPNGETETPPLVERFFAEVYTPMLLWPAITLKPKTAGGAPRVIYAKILSIIAVVLISIYTSVAIYYASLLQTPTEAEKWFPSSHMFATVDADFEKYMQGSNDAFEPIQLVVGMESMNRGSVTHPITVLDGDDRGNVVWDNSFSMGAAEEQSWFTTTCTSLETQTCDGDGCSGGKLIVPGTVNCLLEDLRSWLSQSFTTPGGLYADTPTTYVASAGLLPSGKANLAAAITAYYAKNSTAARQQMAGIIDGELKYIAIEARMSLGRWAIQPNNEHAQKVWGDFVSARVAAGPAGVKSLKDVSAAWVNLIMQDSLVSGMRNGLAITFPIAFGVLLFATHNIVVATLGILGILGIVFCVLGWCKAVMGWSLGISESIAAVMIVGLAVDYVVHLAHMYLEAEDKGEYRFFWSKASETRTLPANSREARFRYAAVKMGGTVLGGAGTTFGAGVIMFACILLFFEKFAVLISVTIMFSLIFSLFFFMPLLALVGPNGYFGDILFLTKHLIFCCACREKGVGGEPYFACKKPRVFALTALGIDGAGTIGCAASEHDDAVPEPQAPVGVTPATPTAEV